jgi:hypothetical protein
MASTPNGIIPQPGFVKTAHQSSVPLRMTSSNQASERPNFVRRSDG